ncbi:predicted protein [Phaeodactylum tricornutum CCAP 1055/1]|uniref:Uncharacterized protein n=2 Tax=Phaeodactylum tricornutum TaxID=2850 RepID=B7G3N3_PHATC|nr:predicted protein [Phaeodactylum tricornutum CCAP 1055/1]EEC46858.1 predicted protein [Phaeodactylum tricornutum CCAP 1055/1]|eukprot:XP_002181644.1 predicted protein [Phaeodactylum tricornutum CCAP 1055/1]
MTAWHSSSKRGLFVGSPPFKQISTLQWSRLFLVVWALFMAATAAVFHYQVAVFTVLPDSTLRATTFVTNNSHEDEGYQKYDFKVQSQMAPTCSPLKAQDIDFTLVTQLSPDRLKLMKLHCERWGNHPISLAVAAAMDPEIILSTLSEYGCNTEMITVSLLNLYQTLHLHRETLSGDHLNALVVPAFELSKVCDPKRAPCAAHNLAKLPKTKDALLKLYETVRLPKLHVAQFNRDTNFHGHSSTRYTDWITQPARQLLHIECVTSDRYEPYIVVRHCQSLPPFQEAFVGFGQNKITWIQQVLRMGYKFYQIGEGFVIHLPHVKSPASQKWYADKRKFMRDITKLKVQKIGKAFRFWMRNEVPDNTQVSVCSQGQQLPG